MDRSGEPGGGDAPRTGKKTKDPKKMDAVKEKVADKFKCCRIGGRANRSFWRSEEMLLCQFFLPSDVAYACIVAVGQRDLVWFLDLNDDIQSTERPYAAELVQCERALDILKNMENQLRRNGIEFELDEEPDEPVGVPPPGDLIDIMETLERLDHEISREKKKIEELDGQLEQLRQIKNTREISDKYLNTATSASNIMADTAPDVAVEEGRGPQTGSMKVRHIAGTIKREKYIPMEQVMYRSSRGKAFMKNEPIKELFSERGVDTMVPKDAFIVFFQGEQLKDKVNKILNGFRANVIETDENLDQVKEMAANIDTQMADSQVVLDETNAIYKQLLEALADNFEEWRDKVLKMKATYATLNNFKSKHHVGEGWVAKSDFDDLKSILKKVAADNEGLLPIVNVIDPGNEEPPTYFKRDLLTDGFQNLINAYGIATYRELNPMPYTVITFPFLFAMMFGDFGHGSILFFFGLYMVYNEKSLLKTRSKNEIRNIFVAGRYIIMFLGIFAMYSGLIYNDCFSRSFNIFGSNWKMRVTFEDAQKVSGDKKTINMDPELDYSRGPYPFGMDPAWQFAVNKIIFLNSFKMKIAILFGVLQMMFGLLLSLWNDIYFRHYLEIMAEFLPQIIWMTFIFVYLCALMFIKWFRFGPRRRKQDSPFCAPSVLIKFINMFLQKKYVPPDGCDNFLYLHEPIVEKVFILCGLVCIPWLFLAKPIALMVRQSKAKKKELQEPKKVRRSSRLRRGRGSSSGDEEESLAMIRRKIKHLKEDESHQPKGEIMIHQGIFTIEYILGTISHTASYLRLWALSLAHAQLSEVLWKMVMANGAVFAGKIHLASIPLFVVMWFFWAVLTFAILCLMEGLSAFLHTLRLHWVEFQSEFYSGLGYEFQPFNYERICKVYRENH